LTSRSYYTNSNLPSNVFLGLAYDKQNHDDQAERAYNAAAHVKRNDALVWQGFISLYEKQADKRLGEYHDAALHLAQLYMDADDKIRSQTVIDKYVDFARKCGSRAQYKHALEILLPTSPIYEFLEGRLLRPAYTYTKIADIVEDEEGEEINMEIGQRRTRLGARIDQVTSDVKREVLQRSRLEELFQCIIDWSDDDESRRRYEEKILQRAYDTLEILPTEDKAEKREHVEKLAQGLVILKHPFPLAWNIVLEWKDVETIVQSDVGLLRGFIDLFPQDGLSKVLRGYLESEISPFPTPTAEALKETELGGSEEQDVSIALSAEDRLMLMTEGAEENSSSVLAKRIMGEYYLYLEEFASAADIVRKALTLLSIEVRNTGLAFQDIADALNIILATALVQYQAPRNHPEARELFENILHRKRTSTSALVGVGLILEEEEEYADAITFLGRALERTSEVKVRAEAAWCKALNGDPGPGLEELEACLAELKGSDTSTKALRAQTFYRSGVCLWTLDDSNAARRDRNGAYARFLASIQADMNFAPSYTSLGIYYADYAKDKKRARKCFQKAFELSSSEVEAAERLARAFARDREWDFVEVVAQRVVESGKVKPAPRSKKKGISWPFVALGVVQLNNQDYAKSIVSFQSALRSSPEDYYSWVGLGESYHNSGRYVAATKAFEQAQRIERDPRSNHLEGTWFSEYMLANVKRELGDFDVASQGYREVLAKRPEEFGVSIALLQTLVEGAWHNLELGFFGRASQGAEASIKVAQGIAGNRDDAFNLWKAIGDSCSIYSWIEKSAIEAPIQDLQQLLGSGIDLEKYNILADIDQLGVSALKDMSVKDGLYSAQAVCAHTAILAQKRAVVTSTTDYHARAVAWYNLGWTEYRAHIVTLEQHRDDTKKKPLRFLKACVQSFKKAIELEAGNADFWNALGIVTMEMNPKVSQHSFIRSLYLNEKSARAWTNLGTLYLLQNDLQLASEALTRAQSTDPEYAHAWLAQGLLAQCLGETSEAANLFTHAFEIADSSSILVKRQYALSVFDDLLSSRSASENLANLLQPLLAVRHLRQQTSSDMAFQHLLALFAERVGDHETAMQELSELCSKLEVEFESSESPITLLHFAQAKSDLGRAQLAEGDFNAAIDNAQTALDLTGEEGIERGARQRIRLSAHLTAGLACFYQNLTDQAIDMFRSALQESQGNPDIVCLLAQILWAKGGEEEQNVAREQLFDCIENHSGHFGAVTLLGVIAILDDDADTIDAVAADLQSLRTREDLTPQQQLKVAQLLTAIATASPGDHDKESLEMSQATTAVMLAPSQPHGWIELSNLVEESYPAEMGVLTARRSVPPRGSLDAEALCKAYAGTNRLDDAQRAVMVAPWTASGWQALA